jgi:hypothetical protein
MSTDARRLLPAYADPTRWRRSRQIRDADSRLDVLAETPARARSEVTVELVRPSSLLLLGVAAALSVGILWALQDALIDDAFITLDYARALAYHGQWGPLPDVPANTATSPLNVLILGGLTVVIRSPMAALWVVAIVNAVLLAVGLIRLGSRWQVGTRFAWVATPLLLLNPLLASSIGLETMMAVTLFVWLLECAVAGDGRRFGWLTGIGLVLRPDLILISGVIWLLHPGLRRPGTLRSTCGTAWRAAVAGLPWYGFSWFYFGSAIPDTLVIKQSQTWGDFTEGLWTRYHSLYPTAVNAVLLVAALGAVAVLATPLLTLGRYRSVASSVAAAGLAGAAYFGAYAQLGVPPYFWYYGLPTVGLILALSFAIAAASEAAFSRQIGAGRILAATLAVVCLAPAVATWSSGLSSHAPLREAPIHGNWALTPQYKQIGLDLAKRLPEGAVVRSAGEFGTILYYCDCTLIDRFDQRGLVMPQIEHARDESWLMKLNYLWFEPDDYPLLRQEYHLNYRVGRTDDPTDWQVTGPTKGDGHYSLRPGPRPQDAKMGLGG